MEINCRLVLSRRESVNDGINISWCSLSYVQVEDAVQGVAAMDRGLFMTKVDIRWAYRVIPIHPADHDLLGVVWHRKLFINAVLLFGLRSTPKIFTAVADTAKWMIQQQKVKFIIHYLNNFLSIGLPGVQRVCSHPDHTVADI